MFFDPDIFGRFLALVMIALAVLLLYERRPPRQLVSTGVLAVLWGGLRADAVALEPRGAAGRAGTLAALRWNVSRALFVAAAVVALGVRRWWRSRRRRSGSTRAANGASSGRANLVSGGLHLFADRPLWGYGSGSFEKEYRAHHPGAGPLAASHTIPVTIAAEQGLIGELAYVALVLVAIVVLIRGARGGSDARGDRGRVPGARVPHDAVRGLPRGSGHVGAARRRCRARARRSEARARSPRGAGIDGRLSARLTVPQLTGTTQPV